MSGNIEGNDPRDDGPDDGERSDDFRPKPDSNSANDPLDSFAKPEALEETSFATLNFGEVPEVAPEVKARWERQWKLQDKIKAEFQAAPGMTAAEYLEVFDPERLHALIHDALGHSAENPIHVLHIVDSQTEFTKAIEKSVQTFLDAQPTTDQLVTFLAIPAGLKIAPASFAEYSALDEMRKDGTDMTGHYWSQAANFVFETILPQVQSIKDLLRLVNLPVPEGDNRNYQQVAAGARYDGVKRGFALAGETRAWMFGIHGFEAQMEESSVEHAFSVLRELFFDGSTESETDEGRIQRVVSVLAGDYLTRRLVDETRGETLLNRWNSMLRQPTLNETPEVAVHHEVRWQQKYLLEFLYARQGAGVSIPKPDSAEEQRRFVLTAERCGYRVSVAEDSVLLHAHRMEEYGARYWTIARALREQLRDLNCKTAADFVVHFDPDRLPDIPSAPHITYADPSEARMREGELEEISITVFFEELERALPQFHALNPSAREVRTILELHTRTRGDVRHYIDAAMAHDRVIYELFERYLGGATSLHDWLTIATYRTQGSYEFESQQRWGYNTYLWRAVQLGSEDLLWMAEGVWGNRMKTAAFSEVNTLAFAFHDVPPTRRTDEHLIPRAVELILNDTLKSFARQRLEHDDARALTATIAALSSGAAVEEVELADIDPEQLARIEQYQKKVLLRFLCTRQNAGAKILVPPEQIEQLRVEATRNGFSFSTHMQDAAKEKVLVTLDLPRQSRVLTVGHRARGFFDKTLGAAYRLLKRANRARKRSWW